MTTHLPLNSITKMNSILNKELEQLGEYKSISSLRYGKENRDTRDTLATPSLASVDFTKSTLSLSHNDGTSGRSSGYTRHQPNPVKIFDSLQQLDVEGHNNKNRMVQKELNLLHSRVLDLEKQVITMGSTTTADNLRKSYLSRGNNISIYNTYEPNRVSQTLGNQPSKDTGLTGSLNRSNIRSSAVKNGRDYRNLRENPLIHQDQLKLSGSSNDDYDPKASKNVVLYTSKKRIGHSAVRQALRRELADTDESSGNEKSNNCSGYLSGRSAHSAAKKKKNKRTQSVNYQTYDQEVADLNKKIKNMRKEYNDDKAALVKERILGNEIAEKIRKMGSKVKRMGGRLENIAKTEADYERLVDSFNKSEQIRNQQRYLIGNLNYELTLLKAEKEKFTEEKEEKEKATVGGNRHNSSSRKKDRKKVRKVY